MTRLKVLLAAGLFWILGAPTATSGDENTAQQAPPPAGSAPSAAASQAVQIATDQDALIQKLLDLLPDKPKEKEEKPKPPAAASATSGAATAPVSKLASVDQDKLDQVGHLIARQLRVETDPSVREILVEAGKQIVAENDRREQEQQVQPPPYTFPDINKTAYRQLSKITNPLSVEAERTSQKEVARAAFEGSGQSSPTPVATQGTRFFSGAAPSVGRYSPAVAAPVVITVPPKPPGLDSDEPPPPDVGTDTDDQSGYAALEAACQKALMAVAHEMADSLQGDGANGVRIEFNNEILAKAISDGSVDDNASKLTSLLTALEGDGGSASQSRSLEAFYREANMRFKGTRHLHKTPNLSIISLKGLVRRAQAYTNDWDSLPEDLRHPGNITRIAGYVLDGDRGDILLIGSTEPGAPPVELDDLTVGIRAVLRDNDYPLCSLDPSPEDIAGPQHVRIRGIPRDSGFAKAMLDADYDMKKIMFGIIPVGDAAFHNEKDLVIKAGLDHRFTDRFWLYPVQPRAGDIQRSTDGSTVLFQSNVQVLSEELVVSKEGYFGTGKTMPLAEEAARSFTRSYPTIESDREIYKRLKGLFDIVLLAKVWQCMNLKSEVIDGLVALPYKAADVPESYRGLTTDFKSATGIYAYTLAGGVEAKMFASPRSFLVLDDPGIIAIRDRSRSLPASDSIATPVADISLEVPEPDSNVRDAADLTYTRAGALLSAGDATGADREITALIRQDPYDPEPLAYRAQIEMTIRDYRQARKDATVARSLDRDNVNSVDIASGVLFNLDIIEGKPDAALAEMDSAIRLDPTSVRSRILRGQALASLERISEARGEFKKAIERDPTSAIAYTDLGLLEIGQGWVVKGRRLIDKARQLSKLTQPTPQINSALAMAEMSTAAAGLGDAAAHLESAKNFAGEALGNPACDPASQILAMEVLMWASLSTNDWTQGDVYIQKLHALAPFLPDIYLEAADAAHDARRDDLMQRYLSQAAQIAPDSLALKALKTKMGVP